MEKFFDKINHDRLMQRLSKGIGDKRLLRLINAFLKTGIMEEGLMGHREADIAPFTTTVHRRAREPEGRFVV